MIDADRRRRDLAYIHITAKALGLCEDERRDVIFTLTSKRSCSELDFTGLQRVRMHFEQRANARGIKMPNTRRPADPMVRKIWAMWLALATEGKVENRSEQALQAFVKRQTGKDRIEWCSKEEKGAVIEALKQWKSR